MNAYEGKVHCHKVHLLRKNCCGLYCESRRVWSLTLDLHELYNYKITSKTYICA